MRENTISNVIIGACIEIHKDLGPGLLESVYEELLFHELEAKRLNVKRQLPMPLSYKGNEFETAYRLDLLVEDKVIVELKSVERLAPVHYAQLLTYLRLSDKKLGLLINFNEKLLRDGVHRMVNGL
ncbi:MAG: GxxExxY protein [Gracilimonas sp.]|uniref:GxxExxY protein n=1 Tax=Gracilimonas sp. TaxID=1974203 RepID=UPI003752E2AA|nr:GxxExxY protein [Gracilimonas sp.]